MSDITALKAQRFKERETKRHYLDIQKLKAENKRVYDLEVKKHEGELARMKKDYNLQIKTLESELEQKLIDFRNKQKANIDSEKERLSAEVHNFKQAHEDQVDELRKSHENQINEITASHKDTLENARQKFLKEKLKWKA